MNKIKLYREEINLNQYELAAATRGIVPRWKIQLAEAGHVDLSAEEREALCYVFRKNLLEHSFVREPMPYRLMDSDSQTKMDPEFLHPFRSRSDKRILKLDREVMRLQA